MNDTQKFAYYAGKNLSTSSSILQGVARVDLRRVIAGNLKYFMQRPGSLYKTANALGVAAKVAPNTVRNLLDPRKRTVTSTKPEGYPTLDKLEALALRLGCEVWELLHPDLERSIREREMYSKIEHDYAE